MDDSSDILLRESVKDEACVVGAETLAGVGDTREPSVDNRSLEISPADTHERDLLQLHLLAWRKTMKSLYYCRSRSIRRTDVVAGEATRHPVASVPHPGTVNGTDEPVPGSATDSEECLACQQAGRE